MQTQQHAMGRAGSTRWPRWMAAALLAATLWPAVPGAHAARVTSVSPQGEVAADIRQIVVRFDEAVVAAGNPALPPPFLLTCQAPTTPSTAPSTAPGTPPVTAPVTAPVPPPGSAHWVNERSWAYALHNALPAGVRCTLAMRDGFVPLTGALEGQRAFSFSTGAPLIVGVQPSPGARIEEDQHFLLRLNGPVQPASVLAAAWCEAEGLSERIPVKLVDGAVRAQVLKARGRRTSDVDAANSVLLTCQRTLAPDARVRLMWGPGIASATDPSVVSKRSQRMEWRVRQRFMAEFSCERENAKAACLPLRPMWLRFNAPVPRAQALAARLVPEKGTPISPVSPRGDASVENTRDDMLSELRFAAPLPESTRFTLVLPKELRDDSGRALANAGNFPLAVATGGMPPLAKFAGAPFGILESGDAANPALMPLTLRHVQADLAGASTGGKVAIKRLDAARSDIDVLRWISRLRIDNDDQYKTRVHSLLATEPDVRRADLPQLTGAEPKATEVIGIPLPQRGLHVIEVESRILGNALLASKAPMYARTSALVTNLSVHFKRGRSSSLVWVTTLDRGRPVAGARVAVNDCLGTPMWSGSTDANGIARAERGFDTGNIDHDKCLSHEGLFVTARAGDDMSFVFSDWNRGIEPWRFNLPTSAESSNNGNTLAPNRRAHTVFDRVLLRAGETVAMKHFVRDDTERGLALAAADTLPTEAIITHVGSGNEVKLPLQWPRGARNTEQVWAIPKNAMLGMYDVTLARGDQRLVGGTFRVEAFRVPLVNALLAPPAGTQVAPKDISFAAQVNAMAGGPMANAPLKLSALLRPARVQFAGYDDFTFEPPGRFTGGEEGDNNNSNDDAQKLVADKLAASTNRNGAATIVARNLPAITTPSDLLSELTFNDPNGEVQTVSQRLRLWPAAVVAGLRVPGWAAARGEAGITALVLGTDGKPLKGRMVEVLGRLHQTMSTRKRIVGGFYAYDNRRETKELGTLCSGSTDAQGRLQCSAKLEAVGEVELVARARDDAGRVSEAASTVYVSGQGEWWFAQDNDDRIDVLPEQREVEPGQTARLQVRMPFRQATALVTIEREGILDTKVVTLSGREPVIELPIPKMGNGAAGRSWAPNVMVSVLVLRGRLRDAPWWSIFTWGWREPGAWWQAFRYEGKDYRAPTAMVDLAKPTFKFGVAQLKVGLAEHKLDVAVTADKAQYGVRQTVKTTVRVTQNGKPLPGAEIAFAAVDEGLLALSPNDTWDLLPGLMQPRPWGVETSTAQGEVIGRRHYGRKALPPGGGGGRNPTRELFDTLLLWRGTVVLDAKGEARIDVPLNDSLTSFRLVAIADAGADKFGNGSTSVRVSQDLQMLAGLPPLAREGDRFDATFTLRNTTQRAMTVQAALVGKPLGQPVNGGTVGANAAPIAPPPQTIKLAAGAALEVRWPVQVPSGVAGNITRIDWEGTADEVVAPGASGGSGASGASGAPARDRLHVQQVVAPAVPVRVLQATLMQLDGNAQLPIAAPADAVPGSASVQASLQPRLSGALPGLRRFFETYPYSCLEQQTSRAIGLHDSTRWALLRDEITPYLDSDGLANYFVPQPGSPPRGSDKLTAYLISAAHEAGVAWPDAVRDTMLQGLGAFVEGRLERRFPTPRADLDVRKLAALDALSRHGRVQPRMLGSISWTPGVWPTSALLDAWGLYKRVDSLPERAARLDELQRLVRSRLMLTGSTLKFSTEATDDWWWLMEGADANAVRLLLLAADTPAWKDDMPQLVTGALARQRRGAWLTTTANLWGVLALERFAQRFESVAVTGRTSLQLAGAAAGASGAPVSAAAATASRSFDWPAAGASAAASAASGTTASRAAANAPLPPSAMLSLPLPASTSASAVTLQVQHAGAGKPWLSVQTLAAVPLQAPMSAGYRVTRSVSAVERKLPGAWSRGDIVRVRVEVDAAADGAWVVLNDPVPAGATLLGSGLGRDSAIATAASAGSSANPQNERQAWPAFVERGFDAWRAYYEWLPRGKHIAEYTLRLNTSGRFVLPPTRVEALYAPDSYGETPNAAVDVRP